MIPKKNVPFIVASATLPEHRLIDIQGMLHLSITHVTPWVTLMNKADLNFSYKEDIDITLVEMGY